VANQTTTRPAPRIAVAGVSGYAGGELARLLLHHPRVATPLFIGREDAPSISLTAMHPQLKSAAAGLLSVEPFSWKLLQDREVELLFLATPHEQSRAWVPEALARGLRVLDLSGAWRLENESNRAIYKFEDADPSTAACIQAEAVYGLPELHRDEIAAARLVANPGCYATSIILALKPLIAAGLVDIEHGIICDAKSGVSGAGKAPVAKTHFMYAADNLSAYGLYGHRHLGELLEQLHVCDSHITFTPHLLPIPRGILSTIYVRFREPQQTEAIAQCFSDFYANSSMVRIYGTPELPQIQYSVRTNYCDIGFHIAPDRQRCILVSCLDNLLKGAAGQAVQNMNVMYGWNEDEGLL
jgi:N-acetyl-gamma-glutamyl-phosphate reductase